jgi:hypothetical protein
MDGCLLMCVRVCVCVHLCACTCTCVNVINVCVCVCCKRTATGKRATLIEMACSDGR